MAITSTNKNNEDNNNAKRLHNVYTTCQVLAMKIRELFLGAWRSLFSLRPKEMAKNEIVIHMDRSEEKL